MLERGLMLTGNDAELSNRALEAVKAKFYEESETRLDDTQALAAIVSCFKTTEKEEQEKETRHTYPSSLGKRLMLGTIISRHNGAKESDPASQNSQNSLSYPESPPAAGAGAYKYQYNGSLSAV